MITIGENDIETNQLQAEIHWSLPQKAGFLLIFNYLILYIFPFPIVKDAFVFDFSNFYEPAFEAITVWFGKSILRVGYDFSASGYGSGDHTYAYIRIIFTICLSIIFTAVILILDKKRNNYLFLNKVLRAYCIYYLAFIAFGYGIVKVFKSQFSFPPLYRLIETYGDSSPMGLAWTFMGYSTLYTFFAGFCEVLGGILIIFKRTRLIGAITIAMVMLNVFMFNLGYDVPVKLYSFHLMLIAVFIASPNFKQMIDFFILKKASQLVDHDGLFEGFKYKRYLDYFRISSLLVVAVLMIDYGITSESQWGDKMKKPDLWGIYNVETYISGIDTIPPLMTDTTRWKQLIIDRWGRGIIVGMNDNRRYFGLTQDSIMNTMRFKNRIDSMQFAYQLKDDSLMSLISMDSTVQLHLKKYDINKFLLVSRGFNWINERPFNR
ncbi:MAG: hypothetical protein KDD94_13245 [Calditrichaeota bacterium]|nr:hypothetical protein [Calditrichota bacterium]